MSGTNDLIQLTPKIKKTLNTSKAKKACSVLAIFFIILGFISYFAYRLKQTKKLLVEMPRNKKNC